MQCPHTIFLCTCGAHTPVQLIYVKNFVELQRTIIVNFYEAPNYIRTTFYIFFYLNSSYQHYKIMQKVQYPATKTAESEIRKNAHNKKKP